MKNQKSVAAPPSKKPSLEQISKNNNAVEVRDLKKSFKDLQVLKGINFSIERGKILAILGPNGAGKTTTIKILSTLLHPDGGKAIVNGCDVTENSYEVKKSIGLTGQYAAVDEILTGKENLIMMGRLYRLNKGAASKRATELLKQFDLENAANRAVKSYSGGMRRRLDLAMSLIISPPIIFLDEPTTGLDPPSRLTLWKVIRELVNNGTTILLTTQYMEEADQLADKIIVIDHGKVIAEGTAQELKQKAGSERIELIIDEGSNFEKAIKALGKTLQIDAKHRRIVLEARSGVDELSKTLSSLKSAKVGIKSISLQRPTLDDVFLKLTGHTATEDNERGENK